MTDQSPTPVPFVDLGLQHRRVAEEVRAGFDVVLDRTAFVLGPQVEQFEREFAAYSGVQYCIGVGNGTDALELALRGAGIGRGDEVIIPANTFVATAEAVVRAGAEIVLADCDEDYLLDPSSVADKITSRTRAVMPVHLYGQLAPMKAVRDVVGSDITIIEDAAQAQGASQDGKRAGSFGVATGTSFYPGKNLGAYGDAGAVLTDSAQITETIQQLRSHGGIKKYEHILVGTNSRLDGLQAVVLSAKLAQLDAWNRERQEAAARYDTLLADLPQVVRPAVAPGNEHVWHLYVIRVPNRDAVLAEVGANGIGAGIHYPLPVHLLPAFSFLGQGAGSHPVAERLAGEIMSLPMFPGITAGQQEVVVQVLRKALGEG